ncbi:MAG: TatD family hydrolase [Bacteroidales bacterium]|nr:TatD family hydrolase [Bacteroidales bacterium]
MLIDIHVHTKYNHQDTLLLLNVFPKDAGHLDSQNIYSVGLHPWHVKKGSLTDDISRVRKAAENPQVIAIGETGLDRKTDVPYIDQLNAFEQQLEIAETFRRPVIIHCVKAYDDIISIRKKFNPSIPWIIHWFNASTQIADELLKNNCYLSFGTMLFKENSKAFGVFKNMPVNRLFLETDDAGINIADVYDKAAKERAMEIVQLTVIIQKNFTTCFGTLI